MSQSQKLFKISIKQLQHFVWLLALPMIISASLGGFGSTGTMAQENTPTSPYTLRELADKNNFHIGAAVYTRHLNEPVHEETLKREFNMITPENEAKFCEVQPLQGEFDFRNFDRLVAFAEANNMMVHGHTLVWHQCVPGWLVPDAFTRDQAIQLLHDHIYTVVGRYKGRVPIWDVVNEAIDDNGVSLRDTPWKQMIGDDYIELAFQFAHEADPDALLFYNDYSAEGINTKSDTIYAMAQDFIARGIPINGIGLQAHYTLGTVNESSVAENIKRFGELGLQVQITEMDDRYDGEATDTTFQRQAADYYKLLSACLDSGYCTAFITWGVSDRFTWLRNRNLGFYDNATVQPLLFDDDYQPKPAYFAVADVLARHAGEAPVLTDDEVATLLGRRIASTGADTDTDTDIPEPTKSDAAQLAPDSVAGEVYYAPFPVTITLDGDDADWANIPRVTVDSGPMMPEGSDTSFTFAAAADDTNLYFLAEVKDSSLIYGTHDPASAWYEEDSVEFYINATGDLSATTYSPGIAQIGIPAANMTNTDPDAPLIGGGNSDTAKVSAKVVQTDDGYRIEASVPLVTDVWKIEPKHLGKIGFQAHLNGASTADRDTKLIWSIYDTSDQSWSNPSLFGQLSFWDKSK